MLVVQIAPKTLAPRPQRGEARRCGMTGRWLQLEATLGDALGERAWNARLGNGKALCAFVSRTDEQRTTPQTGDRVALRVSPGDFSKGRIMPPGA